MEIRNAYRMPVASQLPPPAAKPPEAGDDDLCRRLSKLERRVAELEKQQDAPEPIMPIKCVPAKDVIAAVCSAWSVRVADLLGPRRTQKFSRPRHAAMALMREHSAHMSFPMIARAVNRGDHTTVIHGVARTADLLASDPAFAGLYAKAEALLSEAQNG